MQNIYLFQPQYAIEFRKEDNCWIPYSAGCLWAYASQFDDIAANFSLKDIIFRREPIDQVLDRLVDPVYCGFSCYMWNEQYCLILAEKIKQRWPDCNIQFGGPQSSGKLIRYEFIDSIVMAEGELALVQSLRDILHKRPLEQFYKKIRLEDLDIPSPYQAGIFDQLIKNHPDIVWSMTFETSRGCPYACTFCDWGSVTYSKVKKFDLERVRRDLEWCIGKPIGYLVCADANFGIFKDRDIEIAKIIKDVADQSQIDHVNLQYAKNSSEVMFTIAKIIGEFSRGITVSVQSTNADTLEAIKRTNLGINDMKHLMKLSEEYDVSTYTELILGLPNETLESWKQSFDNLLEVGQHQSIDIWLTQMLENSELAQEHSRKKYGIKTVRVKDYMPLYSPNDCREIDEEFEIVRETNTMTTDEMIEAYMYGWMILHFHIGGYSQIYAKYCRYRKNITYRKFYDCLFDAIKLDNVFSAHYNNLRDAVTQYLHTGEKPKDTQGHILHAVSYEFLYHNKLQVYRLAKSVAETFGSLEPGVAIIQENLIIDSAQVLPLTVNLDFDLSQWNTQSTVYQIEPKIKMDGDFNFYALRRRGLTKNKLIRKN
jgi:putative methyltransferase